MKLKSAYIIRHVTFEDLGIIHGILKNNHYNVKYFEAGIDDLNEIILHEPDLVIILGGPISVYDSKYYDFLKTEFLIVENRIKKQLPTLGICLGAQIIAHVLGSKIYKGPEKEIGWFGLHTMPENELDYFRLIDHTETPVFHWHGDTFDLPSDATLKASSKLYENQAFIYGSNILALQFHLEVMSVDIEKWFIGHAHEIFTSNNIDLINLRTETSRFIQVLEKQAAQFFQRWIKDNEKIS